MGNPDQSNHQPGSLKLRNVKPMSLWRRLLLRPSLRIHKKPIPLELPNSANEFMRCLVAEYAEAYAHSISHENTAIQEEVGTAANALGDKTLVELGLQVWRLNKRVKKLNSGKERRQLEDSYRRLSKILTDASISIDDPTDRPYIDGMVEIEIIAWEPVVESDDAPENSKPFIKETIKPIIRKGGRWIGRGQVIIGDPSA